MISYRPLFKQLYEKKMTKTQLRIEVGFSTVQLAKMNRGESVSLAIIDKICNYLNCSLDEVIEYVKDDSTMI